MAKAASWASTDAHARKRGEQTGLDTLVVHALNDVNWLLVGLNPLVTKLTREVDRLGSTAARLKLKGIDGDPHKRWMMWINSMQREEPYLPLTCQEARREAGVPEREPEHRCCMAVVSSCREMLG
jgi:hypothetical protein